MQHTLKTIADDTGESKDTIRKRYERAKAKHGELGTLVKGVRTFTDDERKILDGFAAEPKAKQTPSKVDVVSEPAPCAAIMPHYGELTFNPAALLDCTNSADETVEALDQISAMTQIMLQGVEGAEAKALHDCERIVESSKAAQLQLQGLKLRISEARAVSKMAEMLKRQSVKEGVEAQAEIESMMEGC